MSKLTLKEDGMRCWMAWIIVGLLVTSSCAGESPSCEVVETSNGEYCVYRGPITETGYVCPDEMPNLYREEGFDFVACGSEDRPDFQGIADEIGGMSSTENSDVLDAEACSTQPVEECECGLMRGNPWDETRECYGEPEPFGCAADGGRPGAQSQIVDPSDRCWFLGFIPITGEDGYDFSDLPANWRVADDGECPQEPQCG